MGGQATAAELDVPDRVTIDATGNLFFCDEFNNRIRKVTNVGQMSIQQVAVNSEQVSVYPNPSNGLFNLSISEFDNLNIKSIEIYNAVGICVHHVITTSPPHTFFKKASIYC
jgi:hypothetical protein